MKILFLDIDGVVNCATTSQRHRGAIGIDPYMALLVDRIIHATGCKVVISSSWRHSKEGLEEIRRQVCEFIDITPSGKLTNYKDRPRGNEIRTWLEAHPGVERYAILDDDSDMLDEQTPNFFKTFWQTGITDEIANKVIEHLNSRANKPHIEDMKKHEIHLEFMKAALNGSYAACANPIVEARMAADIVKRGEDGSTYHALFALEAANAALKAYLSCWSDIKFED